MKTGHSAPRARSESQFGLASLFGFVTVCAILSALAGAIGIVASVLLMLMALALWARQGLLALAMFVLCVGTEPTVTGQVLIYLCAAFLSGWYRLRRKLDESLE